MAIAKATWFAVLPYMIVSCIMYLVGAFVSISWDISQWTIECRIMTAIMCGVFGTGLLLRFDYDGCYYA